MRGSEEFAVRCMKRKGDIRLCTCGHQGGGGDGFPAKANDPLQVMKRHTQLAFPLMAHFDGRTIFSQKDSIKGDVEGIEMLFQDASFSFF